MSAATLLQTGASGAVEGGYYALLALGVLLVFGVMKIVNFAHGELFLAGAYLCQTALVTFGWPLPAAAAAAIAGSAALAWITFRLGLRPVRQLEMSTLLVTFGISIFLANLMSEVWTSDVRTLPLPGFEATLRLGPLQLRAGAVWSLAIGLAALVAVHLLLRHTYWGRAIRATAGNRQAALLAGINVERVDLTAYVVGAVSAALAGILYAGLYFYFPHMGEVITVKAFVLTVLAGTGSVLGLVAAGVILGVTEALTVLLLSSSYREMASFVLFLLLLLVRPSGLFGRSAA